MSIFDWFKKAQRENTYHRFLDIPSEPGVDLFSRTDYDPMFYRHVRLDKDELNPNLLKWFEQFDIEVIWFEAFYTPPYGGQIPIHTDTPTFTDVVKINWTTGAPKSKLVWWEVKNPKNLSISATEFGSQYLTAKPRHCRKVWEVEVTKPSLVNIGVLHSTWNPSEEGRWTLSLPLTDKHTGQRLLWADAVKRFENVLL